MTKIRITLLLLAVGIVVPTTALVLRALESLELENVYRHEAVAERIFDEMERSLSDFLLREEPRPPSDYDQGLSLIGSSTGVSPIFGSADEPFIIGWFSLDAAGVSRSYAPRGSESARITSAVQAALGRHDQPDDARGAPPQSLADRHTEIEKDAPAPGRTTSMGKARLEKKALSGSDEDADFESNAYDVLQGLNRAQALRSERQIKTRRKSAPLLGSSSTAAAPSVPQAEAVGARLDVLVKESTEGSTSISELGYFAEEEVAVDERFESVDSIDAKTESRNVRAREAATVASVDPLIGRLTEAGDLVLTRSVWREGRVDRQGLVLDRAALVLWLRDRVISEAGLSERAHVEFATPDLPPRADTDHRYLHRFAEPFDGLVARLDLEPLAGVGSARPIYALALLLFIVGAIGLYAVDRMIRVVVEFADRRSNFVAAVSHELKTPLTAIRMHGEMLRDGLVASEEKRSEYYATITGESERLSRLIDNVLEFSRLEQDRRDVDLVVGGLPKTIREAAEKLRPHVEGEGFTLQLDLADALPAIRYDRDAITQILFNLVDNALKYSRDAERREILIRLAQKGDHVELSVHDWGPGVPHDELERIFEPFYRVGEELTRTTEGTGIGLALVSELVKKAGGRVRASSPEEGGFVVTIYFDLVPSEDC